jgi:hypothetical protein
MKKILLLILIIATHAVAQEGGKISGSVLDKATKKPLIGVNVVIKGTRLGASTDVDGFYYILNIVPGSYEVTASIMGYQTVTQQNVIVNVSRTTALDFSLQETTVDIGQEVVITAERPDVEKERTSTSEIVRTEDIQLAPGMRDLTDVLSLSADISDGHFRGGREGEELYTLAGMGIVNPLTAASAFAPIVSAIQEVEVITSGFSAQFGNAQSGVVNITMKEGNKNKWTSRAEYRTRAPGYKHWGNSVFSEVNNPYLQMFDTWEKWLGIDSVSGGTVRPFWATIGNGFTDMYKDTILAAKIAYNIWQQARHDLNRKYNNLWDRSVDINFGGPLSENATMFFAGKVENDWQIVPASEPDLTKQMMGNIVYDLAGGMSLRFTGAYTNKSGYDYSGIGSSSNASILTWLWDRAVGVSRSELDNLQLGVRFAHAINQATFYEIKVNRLTTKHTVGSPVLSPNGYRDVTYDDGISTWIPYKTPDQIIVGQMPTQFLDEKTSTITFDASLTSQVTNAHMLLSGIQMNFYNVDVNNRTGLTAITSEVSERYKAKPAEWALYAQDKMEFEGMIANLGLRFDAYNTNVSYYTDKFFPAAGTEMKKTPIVKRLQPRVGISYPVSVSTVFHVNYGSFLQRPAYERMVFSRYQALSNTYLRLGNPLLKPQDTESYDVGLTQGLGEGFTLDVSGYYKDVSNLIQMAVYDNKYAQPRTYETFINRDYADIRGFRVSFNKRKGWITGSLKYNYSVATGSSSTSFDATPTFRNDSTYDPRDTPNPKDVLMDFDRTHNLILQVNMQGPQDLGSSFFGFYPFENFTLGIKSTLRSGRPYTGYKPPPGIRYNKRTPMEYNTDLKITKTLPKFMGANMQFYLEVFNVFNQKIYSYNTVFVNLDNKQKYDTGSTILVNGSPESSLGYYTSDYNIAFPVNQEFLIYSNSPRSFEFGVIINL